MSSEPVLRASELYRFYHGVDEEVYALRGVSLDVGKGETVAIVGPSGSGKSTLLHCCSGIDEPDGGRVAVNGRWMSRRPESERAQIRGREIGVLLQSDNLLPHLTVLQNIALARAFGGPGERTDRALSRLGINDDLAHEVPAALSGGELVRAGIAVALANSPALLLADEPTGELDEETESAVLALLADAARMGTAVVVATHSPRATAGADRTVQLKDGRVVG